MPCYKGPHEEVPGLVRRWNEVKMWARAFIVVSVGGNEQFRISRFRTGKSE